MWPLRPRLGNYPFGRLNMICRTAVFAPRTRIGFAEHEGDLANGLPSFLTEAGDLFLSPTDRGGRLINAEP